MVGVFGDFLLPLHKIITMSKFIEISIGVIAMIVGIALIGGLI